MVVPAGNGPNSWSIIANLLDDGRLTSDAISSAILSFNWVFTTSDVLGGIHFGENFALTDHQQTGNGTGTYSVDMAADLAFQIGVPLPITRDILYRLIPPFAAPTGFPHYWGPLIDTTYNGVVAYIGCPGFTFTFTISNWTLVVTDDAVTPIIPTVASPSSGPVAGGTVVTITGSGFNSATAVTFDGLPASFTIVSDTEITAISPSHAAGDVTIAIVGTGRTVGFTYALVRVLLPPVPRLH